LVDHLALDRGRAISAPFNAVHPYLQRCVGPDLADELAAQTFLVAFDKTGWGMTWPTDV
jgi:hypothetical protein